MVTTHLRSVSLVSLAAGALVISTVPATAHALPAGGVTPVAAPTTSAATSAAPAAATAVLKARWVGGAQVRVGRAITARGTVSAASGVVRLERRVNRTWVAVRSAAVGAGGAWAATVTAPTTKSAQVYRVTWLVSGTARARAVLPTLDVYRLMTYSVTTRGKVVSNVAEFAAAAARTYADPRGWRGTHVRFEKVRRGGDFTLVLAEAKTLPSFSSVCSAQYSCRAGRYVVINETPWLRKTRYFTGTLTTYRRMVVNHETGHRLGLGHAYCSGKGRLAPVMQQQSKGMQGCRPNAWPLASELAKVR